MVSRLHLVGVRFHSLPGSANEGDVFSRWSVIWLSESTVVIILRTFAKLQPSGTYTVTPIPHFSMLIVRSIMMSSRAVVHLAELGLHGCVASLP